MNDLNNVYARLETVPMAPAERQLAKDRLAQADALGEFLVGVVGVIQRLLDSPQPNPAHWRS